MSGLYPNFEPPLFSADNFNGYGLSSNLEELDEIASPLSLVTLSEFVDARTMTLEVLDEEQIPASCPPVHWYMAQEGLATVQRLSLFLEQHPDWVPQRRAAVTADLDHLAGLLQEAQKQDVRFHLLVDI